MNIEELKNALNSVDKSGFMLSRVLSDLAINHNCPEADGFQGPNTFSDCGECIVCLADKLKQEGRI